MNTLEALAITKISSLVPYNSCNLPTSAADYPDSAWSLRSKQWLQRICTARLPRFAVYMVSSISHPHQLECMTDRWWVDTTRCHSTACSLLIAIAATTTTAATNRPLSLWCERWTPSGRRWRSSYDLGTTTSLGLQLEMIAFSLGPLMSHFATHRIAHDDVGIVRWGGRSAMMWLMVNASLDEVWGRTIAQEMRLPVNSARMRRMRGSCSTI